MVTFDAVRGILLELPGVEEGTTFGNPSFKVRKKLVASKVGRDLGEDGDVLMVKLDMADRDMLIDAQPRIYFTAPHYAGYPAVLVRLTRIDPEELRRLLTAAWRYTAPPRLVTEFDASSG